MGIFGVECYLAGDVSDAPALILIIVLFHLASNKLLSEPLITQLPNTSLHH